MFLDGTKLPTLSEFERDTLALEVFIRCKKFEEKIYHPEIYIERPFLAALRHWLDLMEKRVLELEKLGVRYD